ncbi:MAG: glycosyltransferase family A protein [Actinomycetota bacterium]
MSESGVSVIIPVYNEEAYLAKAISSALEQSRPPDEVVVVDDGSDDRSAEIARRFSPPVRVIQQENGGISAARNRGISASREPFLAFLDADDVWLRGKLASQIAAFEDDPSLDAVFGQVEEFAEGAGRAREPHPAPGFLPSCALIRRAIFERVGSFSTRWDVGEWVDWYARAVEGGMRLAALPEVVARRRIHDQNQGLRRAADRGQYTEILKAALDRRRAQAK